MRQSFAKGPRHFNKNSLAIRATCKHFGIPLTYTAIDKLIRDTLDEQPVAQDEKKL